MSYTPKINPASTPDVPIVNGDSVDDAVGKLQGQLNDAESTISTLNAQLSSLTTRVSNLEASSSADTFTSDIVMSVPQGYFGQYVNGNTLPFNGKTAKQAIMLAVQAPIPPTVNLSSSTVIQFNQTTISNVLNFSYVIKTIGASSTATTAVLQWRRNNTGTWTTLDTSVTDTTFTHNYTDTNFNTQPFNYQYIVTDSSGATATATLNITPASYLAPSISISQAAVALNGTQTNTSREIGNINTNVSGSVTQRSSYVPLSSYQLQYQINGGAWTNLGGAVAISGSTTISAINHNDTSLKNSTSIGYRFAVVDSYTTTYSSVTTINFQYLYVFGYSSTNALLSDAATYALGNGSLQSTRARTITLNAGAGMYAFISYPASFGNIVNIIQDGATPVLGAFTLMSTTLTVTNQYGVTGTYLQYKSNATNAFTNNSEVIS